MGKRKRSRRRITCYMCDRSATSKEHVPPLCFFPEKEEFVGAESLRQNLITVPSCDKHNLAKASDDQYICTVLAFHFENNPIAQAHFSAKIKRSLMRKPAMFGFFRHLTPAVVRGSQSAAFFIDRIRFDRAIDHVARGIYFHHFAKKYIGKTNVMSYSLFDISSPEREEVNAALQEWRRYSDTFLTNQPKFGDNPTVFYYQVVNDIVTQKVLIRLVFYNGFVVDIYLRDAQPTTESVPDK